jgi:DNA-binding NtrC family response regulator
MAAALDHAQPPSPADEPDGPMREASPTILVIDDDPLLGGLVEACLDFEGARVLSAHSLAEARDLLDPRLAHIVLDRRLPDGDGLELLDELRGHCPGVPVVVYSSLDDAAEPPTLPRLPKTDIAALVNLIGL